MAATFPPPVMQARRWLEQTPLPPGLDLINVSQAAPMDPPPAALREELARLMRDEPAAHRYGPALGLPPLREELATTTARRYGGSVAPGQVAITAGCNQAFCAAIATLAGPGDAVLLPFPWYFNHRMWLDMAGVAVQPLPAGDGLVPDPDAAARAITPATRAIVLVSPNNPAGVEYPADLLAAFRDLARARGIALILDETYRDFHSLSGPPHPLFADPGWDDTLIHLYSFSKAYRLTGHRVGAILASPARLAEVEKFLDTVAICAPQPGQAAALWGLRHLGDWLEAERREILARCAALRAALSPVEGWRILASGAYFAYVGHDAPVSSDHLARALLAQAGILALPGTMFAPAGEALGDGALRLAFANLDSAGIALLARRLADVNLQALAPPRDSA